MVSSRPSDFPSIYRDFVQMFPDVSACAAYLDHLQYEFVFGIQRNMIPVVASTLVGREAGGEKNGSFAFGKALFANPASEQSGIVGTISVLEVDISFASKAVFRTVFIQAAKGV